MQISNDQTLVRQRIQDIEARISGLEQRVIAVEGSAQKTAKAQATEATKVKDRVKQLEL